MTLYVDATTTGHQICEGETQLDTEYFPKAYAALPIPGKKREFSEFFQGQAKQLGVDLTYILGQMRVPYNSIFTYSPTGKYETYLERTVLYSKLGGIGHGDNWGEYSAIIEGVDVDSEEAQAAMGNSDWGESILGDYFRNIATVFVKHDKPQSLSNQREARTIQTDMIDEETGRVISDSDKEGDTLSSRVIEEAKNEIIYILAYFVRMSKIYGINILQKAVSIITKETNATLHIQASDLEGSLHQPLVTAITKYKRIEDELEAFRGLPATENKLPRIGSLFHRLMELCDKLEIDLTKQDFTYLTVERLSTLTSNYVESINEVDKYDEELRSMIAQGAEGSKQRPSGKLAREEVDYDLLEEEIETLGDMIGGVARLTIPQLLAAARIQEDPSLFKLRDVDIVLRYADTEDPVVGVSSLNGGEIDPTDLYYVIILADGRLHCIDMGEEIPDVAPVNCYDKIPLYAGGVYLC